MGPQVYFWYAGAQALICAWALWLWRQKCAPGALIIAAGAAMLLYNEAVLAVGHLLGQGPLLETLSRFRYGVYVTVAPLSLIAAVRIAAAAHVQVLRSGPWLWSAWAVIVLLLVHGFAFAIGGLRLEPACLGGALRYAAEVPANQVCNPGQVPLAASVMPVSVMVSDIVVAIIGATIWGKRSWPWLFLGSFVVFVAAKFPQAQYGPLIGNASAVAWTLALVATSARFASMPVTPCDTFTSTIHFNDTASFATRTLHKKDLST